jgi:hypothetical protein
MLVCGCGRWMHTEGVEERSHDGDNAIWLVRWECRACGFHVGAEGPAVKVESLVDRTMWTDEARHRLERIPPYAAPLVRDRVESYARQRAWWTITYDRFMQAGTGQVVVWDAEAERRLAKVPAPVRAMARVELERTAAERGDPRVTVALMEEVKARYFGMGQKAEF